VLKVSVIYASGVVALIVLLRVPLTIVCFLSSYFIKTLRTGAFKLFKCTFPGSKQFKSTFILCFFKYL